MTLATATILSNGQVMDPAYALVALEVRREVNRIPEAEVVLVDGDAAQRQFAVSNARFFEPGREIEIKLRCEGGRDASVFKGVVVRHAVEADAHGSLLRVEAKDRAVKLTEVRKSVVFRNHSDSDAIAKIVREAGLKVGTVTGTKPMHPQLVQYQATDWDFLVCRAEAQGLAVVVDGGMISAQRVPAGGAAKKKFEFGISELYEFAVEVDATRQYPAVEGVAWDVKEKKLTGPRKAAAVALAQGNLDGRRLARAVGFPDCRLTDPVALPADEVQAWADARLARSRLALVRGRLGLAGAADLKLLDVIEIAGIGARFNGTTQVTGIRHSLDQNGWRTDVQFGLPPDGLSRRDDVADAAAAGLLPPVRGLQVGVVDRFQEDPDKQLRVRVQLPGVGAGTEAVWARLATPDAGAGRGWYFRPEPGDEVVVGFFNDDPRYPVVLGALYGPKNQPHKDVPAPSADNKHRAIVSRKGTTIAFVDDDKASVSIVTAGKNKVLLDDKGEKIELSDQHGNTVTLDKNGIVLKSAKDLKIEASGNVEIKGAKVDVK